MGLVLAQKAEDHRKKEAEKADGQVRRPKEIVLAAEERSGAEDDFFLSLKSVRVVPDRKATNPPTKGQLTN